MIRPITLEVFMRATVLLAVTSPVSAVAPAQTKQPVDASPKDKIELAKQLLEEAKKALMNDGKYDCCIKDACDRCALDHQNCDCATDVKAGRQFVLIATQRDSGATGMCQV
jgi:hypothetical protein